MAGNLERALQGVKLRFELWCFATASAAISNTAPEARFLGPRGLSRRLCRGNLLEFTTAGTLPSIPPTLPCRARITLSLQ